MQEANKKIHDAVYREKKKNRNGTCAWGDYIDPETDGILYYMQKKNTWMQKERKEKEKGKEKHIGCAKSKGRVVPCSSSCPPIPNFLRPQPPSPSASPTVIPLFLGCFHTGIPLMVHIASPIRIASHYLWYIKIGENMKVYSGRHDSLKSFYWAHMDAGHPVVTEFRSLRLASSACACRARWL